jgi:hypothetical protein
MGRRRLTPNMRTLVRQHGIVAFELAIMLAGNQTRFAQRIGATDQKVSHWKLRDQAIPIDWVPPIVAAFDHPLITPYTLRPDLAPFWDLLTPQLAACAADAARREFLTHEDYAAAAKSCRTVAGSSCEQVPA